jgi:hypothetical protein
MKFTHFIFFLDLSDWSGNSLDVMLVIQSLCVGCPHTPVLDVMLTPLGEH